MFLVGTIYCWIIVEIRGYSWGCIKLAQRVTRMGKGGSSRK